MGYLDELKLQRNTKCNTKMQKVIQDLRTKTLKETRTESSSPFQKKPPAPDSFTAMFNSNFKEERIPIYEVPVEK